MALALEYLRLAMLQQQLVQARVQHAAIRWRCKKKQNKSEKEPHIEEGGGSKTWYLEDTRLGLQYFYERDWGG